MDFKSKILKGISYQHLEKPILYDKSIPHAPKKSVHLNIEEKKLALKNALRYFKPEHHPFLAKEFSQELETYGHIYMYRFRPDYPMFARPIESYPHRSKQAAAIMLMIQNNLDPTVAQYPHELITYGGNGAVFQNWAQYVLTMQYLAVMTDQQTLVLYSGHPLGLFPSTKNAPRVVISNGLMVPNYSTGEQLDRLSALGVTQYGQMTAGSFMYIGPQGIVHGTTITLLNAGRLNDPINGIKGKIFVSSGLGGMSGAQAKASVITGAIGIIAEINPAVIKKRYEQGWVDEIYADLDLLIKRAKIAKRNQEAVSLAYQGNIVDLWESLAESDLEIAIGSDQTSLHNPFQGGYYPVDLKFDDANKMMHQDPIQFKECVQSSLKRQIHAINNMAKKGMYFFDYGNAFLLEAGRAGADVWTERNNYKYHSYVEDIMGPHCFDYGFGPFRWVCASGKAHDLELTDRIATEVLKSILETAPKVIQQQLKDNLNWITNAQANQLVVGSQARILYADAKVRIEIAQAFNQAIAEQLITGPIILGRDHHDVSGTDSPYRETANIYDGSSLTADMSFHNVVGDACRGATWVSLHNGGGVGFGEAINGGFGLVLDGTEQAKKRACEMLYWDVNHGIARRSWARNSGAMTTINLAMEKEPNLCVTMPHLVDESLLDQLS